MGRLLLECVQKKVGKYKRTTTIKFIGFVARDCDLQVTTYTGGFYISSLNMQMLHAWRVSMLGTETPLLPRPWYRLPAEKTGTRQTSWREVKLIPVVLGRKKMA